MRKNSKFHARAAWSSWEIEVWWWWFFSLGRGVTIAWYRSPRLLEHRNRLCVKEPDSLHHSPPSPYYRQTLSQKNNKKNHVDKTQDCQVCVCVSQSPSPYNLQTPPPISLWSLYQSPPCPHYRQTLCVSVCLCVCVCVCVCVSTLQPQYITPDHTDRYLGMCDI
jgi:hypothetical protein